jgi:glycosyltransferase domain-containing protein
MSEDLTIILLLKDQANFTWRWFKYQNDTFFPFKILVADGGKDESVEQILKDESKYPNLNYEYIRYPHDKDIATFFKKVSDAISRVKTKYVLMASNDDFYIVEALKKSVEFLNENKDYVVSRGDVYDFRVRQQDKKSSDEDIYGKMVNVINLYTNASNTGTTAIERVRTFSEFSNSLWHDVSRTDKLKNSYQMLVDSGIVDLDLSDRLINYYLCTQGKIHRGKYLYMLHQSHQAGLGHVLARRDTFDWIMTESWPKDVSTIFNITAENISEVDGTPIESARNKVMQYYLCFILGKKMIRDKIQRSITNKPPTIVRWGRILSKDNKLRIFLKNIYVYLKEYWQEKQNAKFIVSSPYRDDIENVSDFLMKKPARSVVERAE